MDYCARSRVKSLLVEITQKQRNTRKKRNDGHRRRKMKKTKALLASGPCLMSDFIFRVVFGYGEKELVALFNLQCAAVC